MVHLVEIHDLQFCVMHCINIYNLYVKNYLILTHWTLETSYKDIAYEPFVYAMACCLLIWSLHQTPVASFTKEVTLRLAKRPLKINGRLANRELTSLVKEATGNHFTDILRAHHWNLVKICYTRLKTNDQIRLQFCTCHNSSAVVACANL